MNSEMKKDSAAEAQPLPERHFEADSANMVGQRLDYALTLLLPQMGLRGRKRCIESGQILVNGRSCAAAQRLRRGDVVALADAQAERAAQPMSVAGGATCAEPGSASADPAMQPRLLERQGEFFFFFKII